MPFLLFYFIKKDNFIRFYKVQKEQITKEKLQYAIR